MCQVIFVVDAELIGGRSLQLIRVFGTFRLNTLFAFVSYAEDVRDDVPYARASALCLQAQRNLDVWLAFCIRIVLGIFTQTLMKSHTSASLDVLEITIP